ncbi:MAG: hypothetical protein ACRDYC_09275 [Acidimicrobiales bacterium]
MKSKRRILRLGLGSGVGALAMLTFSFFGGATAAYAQSTSTCPTDAYTGQTVAGCSTAPTLTVSYNAGTVTWEACGYTQGVSVSLAIDGNNASGTGASEAAGTDGCTDPTVSICLTPGSHSATASASGYADATASFTVTTAGCTATATSTGLASTGADVIGGLALALLTIVGGSTLLSAVNRRRHSVR